MIHLLLLLAASAWSFRDDRSQRDDKGRAVSIVMIAAPVGGVVGCAIAFLVCVYLYKRASQRSHDPRHDPRNLYLQAHTHSQENPGVGGSCSEPLYEELDNVKMLDEKSNIYVDRNDMLPPARNGVLPPHGHQNGDLPPPPLHMNGGSHHLNNGEAVPLTSNKPSAPPMYLYDHNDS